MISIGSRKLIEGRFRSKHEAIVYLYMMGFKPKEIASRLNVSVSYVYVALNRAKKRGEISIARDLFTLIEVIKKAQNLVDGCLFKVRDRYGVFNALTEASNLLHTAIISLNNMHKIFEKWGFDK